MGVAFTPDALADLKEIGRWIAQDDPQRARTFGRQLSNAAVSIGRQPQRYPLVRRTSNNFIRKRVHRNYLIFYRVTTTNVQILRVVHGARDWAALLDALE